MFKIMNNVLSKPPKMKAGQVWRNGDTAIRLVITDTKNLKMGIVRALMLGEDNFGDNKDIVIKKKNYSDLLTRDKCTMRVTDGPISIVDLNQYLFSLNEEDTKKIIASLKNTKYNFLEMQELINQKYLTKLEILHLKAVAAFESNIIKAEENKNVDNVKIFSINLFKNSIEEKSEPYQLGLAASTKESKKTIDDFYDKEFKLYLNGDTVILCETDDYNVRLTTVDNYLYLVFINDSTNKHNISNIKLECIANKKVINPLDKSLTVEERAFTAFDASNIETGAWQISFKDNDKVFTKEISFNVK